MSNLDLYYYINAIKKRQPEQSYQEVWDGVSYWVFTNPVTHLRSRHGIRLGYQVVDEELTVYNPISSPLGGFEGAEGVGWVNVEAILIPYLWVESMLESYLTINSHITYTPAQETLIKERLSEDYVVTTFGAGLNKTICDFFIFFENSNITTNLAGGTTTKTGDTLRWNYGDSNVYDQNNLPAQTNNGVISVTSTDGFNAVTAISWITGNTFIGSFFDLNYYMPNITWLDITANSFSGAFKNIPSGVTWFKVSANDFTGAIPALPHVLVNLDISGNNFTSGIPADLANNPHLTEFIIYQNPNLVGEIVNTASTVLNKIDCLGTKISGIHLSTYSMVMTLLRCSFCRIPSADLDVILSGMNTYYTGTGAFTDCTLDFRAEFNGDITDGLNNTDYLSLNALWVTAGKTLTAKFNTDKGQFNKGKVLFTFDDGGLTVHSNAFPLFTTKGITGTVYQNNSLIDTHIPAYDEDGLGWEELIELEAAGWNIGSHGNTHVNFTGLTEAQMITSVTDSITGFIANGLPSPTVFSYPNGGHNATSKSVMQTYFNGSRISDLQDNTFRFTIGKNDDPYVLPCRSIDNHTLADIQEFKDYIDTAFANKTAVIFLSHGVRVTPTSQYHTRLDLLEAIIDYIQTKDMDIINHDDLVTLMACGEATDLFDRMEATVGEAPIITRKANIDTTIKALKTANLFKTRFDGLWLTRSHAVNAAKLNWIKNDFNLTKIGAGALTFVQDLGFSSDGSTSCLEVDYAPNTDKVKLSLDSATFGYKISGTIGANTGHGASDATNTKGLSLKQYAVGGGGAGYYFCNCGNAGGFQASRVIGYNAISRYSSTKYLLLLNAGVTDSSFTSTGITSKKLGLLAFNHNDTFEFFCASTEILEVAYVGASISQAEFLTLQGIINDYIAAL
jgi:peptidoglycan/xylan/chitin deacetylase (PgdA/CDA1 family)